MTKLKRPISAYLRDNVHYTFRGFNFPPTFLALLLELGGVDRIMFSADHPYQSMAEARAFLEQLPVSAADRERIAHGNAEKLSSFSSNDHSPAGKSCPDPGMAMTYAAAGWLASPSANCDTIQRMNQ